MNTHHDSIAIAIRQSSIFLFIRNLLKSFFYEMVLESWRFALCSEGMVRSVDRELISQNVFIECFRKSTPPQNHQLVTSQNDKLTILWGS